MPVYDFRNKQTGEILENVKFTSWKDKDQFLIENPSLEMLFNFTPSVVSGITGGSSNRVPSGFNEVLAKVAENHPNSSVADKVGGRSIKEAKTREIIKKHVDKMTKNV